MTKKSYWKDDIWAKSWRWGEGEKSMWEINIPGSRNTSTKLWDRRIPGCSRNSKFNVAGTVSKENSRGWDQRWKGGGRRNPIGPCKPWWGLWLLLDWNGKILEGFEPYSDMIGFPFKKNLKGFCVGSRGPRVETGIRLGTS